MTTGDRWRVGPGEFSVIVVPDTQAMSAHHPEVFSGMTRWITAAAAELNVRMVLHLGDMVDAGAAQERQFRHAEAAWATIVESGLPFLGVPGNHDYDNMIEEDRALEMFRRYFGVRLYEGRPWFGGTFEPGAVENLYATIEVAGEKWLFVGLEFGPRDHVLTWADVLLREHADHHVVIATHCYMYMDGGRNRPGAKHNPKVYRGAHGANDGDDVWQKLVCHHPNVVAVFSGHQIFDHVSYCVECGRDGRAVLQSYQNWQCAPEGGEGRLRVVTFSADGSRARFGVFNTKREAWEREPGYEAEVTLADGSGACVRFPAQALVG